MMGGKITLNLAISLDGYIADENGGYDWIGGHGDKSLDTPSQPDFGEFLSGVDVVVMGKRCYEQNFHSESGYADKIIYVATHEKRADEGNIRFISDDVVGTIMKEKQAGKMIYLFGGGISIDPFIKADVIDEYRIGMIPVILGSGRPLFLCNNPTIPLHLDSFSISDGIVGINYTRKSK